MLIVDFVSLLYKLVYLTYINEEILCSTFWYSWSWKCLAWKIQQDQPLNDVDWVNWLCFTWVDSSLMLGYVFLLEIL